jgi:hypothetical protein
MAQVDASAGGFCGTVTVTVCVPKRLRCFCRPAQRTRESKEVATCRRIEPGRLLVRCGNLCEISLANSSKSSARPCGSRLEEKPARMEIQLHAHLESYPLPWNMQAAAVYQNLPGPNYRATVTFTRADVLPSLGRNLNAATVSLQMLPPLSAFSDERINQLDLRVSRIFRMKSAPCRA